jgi:hypothetical protein
VDQAKAWDLLKLVEESKRSLGCLSNDPIRTTTEGQPPNSAAGRKRVLAIVAGILVARHLKNPEDLHESRPSPRTESLIASAVQWAERIMRRIEGVYR